MSYPKRKSPRMKGFDYATPTAYFVTICTHDKRCIFGKPEQLTAIGQAAYECIQQIPFHFPGVHVEKAVIMPNHVHLLLGIYTDEIPQNQPLPNLSSIIGKYKAAVTRRVHCFSPALPIWQRSFHDHVIRTEQAWREIWKYIDENPRLWEQDCFHQPM